MSLAALGDIDAIARDLVTEARTGKSTVVVGPTGSGRLTLSSKLRVLLGPRGIHVSLPPFQGHDGPTHGLLQIAAALGEAAVEVACDTTSLVGERARKLAANAAHDGRVIVVRVPESWQLRGDVSASRQRRESNAVALIEGLTTSGATVVLVLHEDSNDLASEIHERVELAPARIDKAELARPERWGSYRHAFELVRACERADRLSPIQFRVLVGATALGQNPDELIATLAGGIKDLRPVIDSLIERLVLAENKPVADAFIRLASARFPVEKKLALDIAAPPEGHIPLFTECVGYVHDGRLRVPDQVRAEVMNALRRRRPGWRTHDALAQHHRSLDGVSAPPADASKITHWLERAHHLGHMGWRGETEWESLHLAGPEQILDRAWSLSAEYRSFEPAADLYRRVLKAAPKDAYAWHYLAYNLERTSAPREEVEAAYRMAVEIDPPNPWWNSRLITFLIKDLRYGAADAEWAKSLERVDPKGDRVRRSPLLARHFHCWVVEEWLRHGEVERAARVYRMIPRRWFDEHVVLERLRQRFEDALEAIELGESVYPADVPIAKRWQEPLMLQPTWNELERQDWMPGRVLKTAADAVSFVVASGGTERRVFKQTASIDEWKGWAGSAPRQDQFFEMGFYGANKNVVHVCPANAQASDSLDSDDGYDVMTGPISMPAIDVSE